MLFKWEYRNFKSEIMFLVFGFFAKVFFIHISNSRKIVLAYFPNCDAVQFGTISFLKFIMLFKWKYRNFKSEIMFLVFGFFAKVFFIHISNSCKIDIGILSKTVTPYSMVQ